MANSAELLRRPPALPTPHPAWESESCASAGKPSAGPQHTALWTMRLKRKVDIVSKNLEEGCSVRATLNRVLSQEVLKDPRLHRTTKLVYLGMRAHQKTTIKGYAALLGLPYSTVLRAVKELNSFGGSTISVAPERSRKSGCPGCPCRSSGTWPSKPRSWWTWRPTAGKSS